MARYCTVCNIKLSFFSRKPICKYCYETKYDYYFLKDNILEIVNLADDQLSKLTEFGSSSCMRFYDTLIKKYAINNRLGEEHIINLRRLSNSFSIPDKMIEFEERNKEDVVIQEIQDYIKWHKSLPEIDPECLEQLKFKMQDDETYHFTFPSALFQIETLASYQSAGRRIVNKGPKLKTKGNVLFTSKRFYYIPELEGKLLTLDYSKITKYNIDDPYLYIRKESREKAYLFFVTSASSKISMIILDYIFNKK